MPPADSTGPYPADPDATHPPPDGATRPPPDRPPGITGPAPPAPPGYEIAGELGRGGMGVVYGAAQRRLGRPVALKVVLAGPHADATARARFLAEAAAVAAVAHPHVVRVYDFGEAAGVQYLA